MCVQCNHLWKKLVIGGGCEFCAGRGSDFAITHGQAPAHGVAVTSQCVIHVTLAAAAAAAAAVVVAVTAVAMYCRTVVCRTTEDV